MIVEEYDFYQQLPHKMQTELINKLFNKFMKQFGYFFGPCEKGFRNECVIWLYSRVYAPGRQI